jgi:CheY-like chemotaxis protein
VTTLAPAIGTPRPGRYVEIEVHDTGEGISPQCRERIFDPFFTTKGVGQGTGLGLAIVYGIVRSHNGWIEVDSQPGSTTFRICLPALSDALPQEAPPEATIELRHDAGCVLAVDDEPGVLRLIRHTLGRLGYRVLEASSGDEAIELMATHAGEVDLLVLDYAMPGRDGITTLFELRRLSPDLPVLLASGLTERLAEIETTPHLRLLPKPFRPDDLAAAVHELLRQRSAVDG